MVLAEFHLFFWQSNILWCVCNSQHSQLSCMWKWKSCYWTWAWFTKSQCVVW